MEAKDHNNYEHKDLNDIKLRTKLANTPRRYILEGEYKENLLRFYAFGCAGENNKAQRKVAKLMGKVAAESKKPPFFILELGDNFYRKGVRSAEDPLFEENFSNIYLALLFAFFLGLGNHDHDKWSWGTTNVADCIAAYQVLHSYLNDGKFSPELYKQFSGFRLDVSKLRKYNMPSRNYSLYARYAEIFMVDSTPLVSEWLRSERGKLFVKRKLEALYSQEEAAHYYRDYLKVIANTVIENNPIDWLYQGYHHSDVPIKIIGLHHPVDYTADKRAFDSDSKLYLSKDEIKFLAMIGITGCYGDILGQIFEIEKFNWDLIISAHIHGMYLYNDNHGKIQVVSGAGGSNLQYHRNFSEIENLLLYVREHGFVEVVVSPNKKISINFHSTEKKVWVFKHDSNQAVRQFEDNRITYFREVVLSGVVKYFKFLDKEQTNSKGSFLKWSGNASHRDEGVMRADNLRNYLNQFKVDDLMTTIKMVFGIIKESGDRDHSLKTLVNKEIFSSYRLTIEDLLVCGNQKSIVPYKLRQKNDRNTATFFKRYATDDIGIKKVSSFECDEKSHPLVRKKR